MEECDECAEAELGSCMVGIGKEKSSRRKGGRKRRIGLKRVERGRVVAVRRRVGGRKEK